MYLEKIESKKMSSKQIAERAGKEHKNVLRDIRNMLDELKLDGSNLNHVEYEILKDARGYDSEILLNERLSLCLASGYSIALRMKIIDDWAQMKAELLAPKQLSRLEILEIAIESERKVLQLEAKIEQDKEKVQFFDTVTGSEDCIDMGQVAKVCNLGIGRNRLFEFLRENKILDGKNSPYQTYIDRRYFRIIESSYTKPDGSTHISIKTVVFQKGVDFIIKKYNNR